MTPARWRRIESIYHSALERDAGQRSAFLDDQCQGDETLRREVESLLSQEGSFLEHPAWDLPDLKSGARLGPYEIVALLGKGGMGEVYRAHDPKLNRQILSAHSANTRLMAARLPSAPSGIGRARTCARFWHCFCRPRTEAPRRPRHWMASGRLRRMATSTP
jgi:hypothetical protein